MCAQAEFIAFGKTEDIGRVPMQNLLLLAELKALGVCPWGRRERRDGRCARRGVATSSPAWPGRPYPVRPVESALGTQTPHTRHPCDPLPARARRSPDRAQPRLPPPPGIPPREKRRADQVRQLVSMIWHTSTAHWAMRQRIMGSHTPPCHRRMVITTQFGVLPCCTTA